MRRPPIVDRRAYLRGIAAATVAGTVPAAAGVAGGEGGSKAASQPDDDRRPRDGIPVAHPFVGDLDGLNADAAASGDMEFNVENRYPGDPDEGDREWVLHYTTDGRETQDYPAALINLQQRLEDAVTLRHLEEGGELEFDFYVGPDHTQYMPGQVYLVIQEEDQKRKDEKGDRAWGLYRNVRHGGPREEWRTLDVVQEMAGGPTGEAADEDAVWRALEIDVDPDGFQADFNTFGDAILEQAIDARDEVGETFDDVFAQYDGDSELLAAGLGSGSSSTPSVRDIHFDDYRIAVDGVDRTFELPAALPMAADVDDTGQIEVTLSFEAVQEDVDLNDVDEDTVRLYPFSQVVPPVDEGADPTRVTVTDDEIEARFPPGQVRRLPGLSGGEQRVVVAGEFDYDHVVWFFGIGDVDVPGN